MNLDSTSVNFTNENNTILVNQYKNNSDDYNTTKTFQTKYYV